MSKFVVPPQKTGGRKGNAEHPRISFGFYKIPGDEKGQTDIMALCSDKKLSERDIIYRWLEVGNPTDATRTLLYTALHDLGLLKE